MKNIRKAVSGWAVVLGAMLTAMTALAGGDLYEIIPAKEDVTSTFQYSSLVDANNKLTQLTYRAKPLGAGEKVYFILRFQVRKDADQKLGAYYKLDHVGLGSVEEDSSTANYPQMGIYIGDRHDYAIMVKEPAEMPMEYAAGKTGEGYLYETVFEYTTKPGDVGLPITLALKGGGKITVNDDASQKAPDTEYEMKNLGLTESDPWRIRYYEPSIVSGETVYTPSDAVYTFSSTRSSSYTLPEDDKWFYNFSLSQCGFYVNTIEFAGEPDDVRVGHDADGMIQIIDGEHFVTNLLSSSTLYAWAVDPAWLADPKESTWKDPAVTLNGENTDITIGYKADGTAITKSVSVATVQIKAGMISASFTYHGEEKDRDAVIIVSSSKDFNYQTTTGYTLIDDYLKATVSCVDADPELSLEVDDGTGGMYTVNSDYANFIGKLALTLNEAYTEDITVTITPRLVNTANPYQATDVVRIYNEPNEDQGWKQTDPLQMVIKQGYVKSQPVYVYGMGAHANQNYYTSGKGNEVTFDLAVDKGGEFIKKTITCQIYVKPNKPAIANATELAGHEIMSTDPLTITMDDNFTDVNDTATGYAVYAMAWNTTAPTDREFKNGAKKLTTEDGAYSSFKPDSDGNLVALDESGMMIADEVPVAPSDIQGYTHLRLRITAPNTATTEYLDLSIEQATVVKAHAYDSKSGTDEPESFPEITDGDSTTAWIGVTLDKANTSGSDLYAFLKLTDESKSNLVSGGCIIVDGKASGKGIRIKQNEKVETARRDITLLDGVKDDTLLQFEVVLCTSEKYDATKKYSKYDTSTDLEVTVVNVNPALDNISMNGWNFNEEKTGFDSNATATLGVNQEFVFTVIDADLDLGATGDDKFVLTCQFSGCNPVTQQQFTLKGNPNTLTVTNKFRAVGTCTMTVTLKDKDSKSATFKKSYTFTVSDHPYITVDGEVSAFDETVKPNPTYKVTLSENTADEDLTVKLSVKSTGKKIGSITLDGDFTKSTVAGEDDIYYCTYKSGVTSHKFYVSEADGAESSASEFEFVAEVITTTLVPNTDTKWCDYYSAGTMSPITVNNVAPILYVNQANTSNPESVATLESVTNSVAIGDEATIRWNVNDVTDDLKGGISVVIQDQYGEHDPIKVTEYSSTSYEFKSTFTTAGYAPVIITATDKDGGISQITVPYLVKSARMLKITAVGPSAGSSAPHVQHYRGSGLGMGHVYTSSKVASSGNWSFYFNCAFNLYVDAYAQGYQAHAVDDGTLSTGKDIPIDKTGAKTDAGKAKSAYYEYDSEYDSFFYCWVKDVYSEGTLSSEIFGAVAPQQYTNSIMQTTINLPTEKDDEGVYDDTLFEAIFSREWKKSDNIGDINGDGIPDIYAKGYAFDIFDDIGKVTGNDMEDLSQDNTDADYFPYIFAEEHATFVPNTSNSWVSQKRAFTTQLEIRGWGECLNDAWQQLSDAGKAGSIVQYASDIIRTNPSVDTNSTLSALEYDAYVQAGKPEGWSPERPTNPMVSDTDGDGMADGYEYYIWYKAHVGWIDGNGVHQYLSGRKYVPTDPYSPTILEPETLASLFDPLVSAGSDWDTRDTDNDGLTDYAESVLGSSPFDFDTDGDGLPDGYEVAITKTDACKYATDGVNADGTLNSDNDAAAILTKSMYVVGVLGAGNATEYVCCPEDSEITTRIDTNELSGTSFFIVSTNDNSIATNSYITTKTIETYTDDEGYKCLIGDYPKSQTWTTRYAVYTNGVRTLVRGTATKVSRGTRITGVRDVKFHNEVAVFPLVCYRAWVSGSTLTRGQRLYGLSDSMQVSESPEVRDVRWMHWHVYQELDFNPKTAWTFKQYAGVSPVNTSSYTHLDEFLSMVYFYRNGVLSADKMDPKKTNKTWPQLWAMYSTSPVNADTDGDGMPDGWEFYLMAGRGVKNGVWFLNSTGTYTGAAPDSDYSPIHSIYSSDVTDSERDIDTDYLIWPDEYSGTKSSARYGWSPTYPRWRNKYMPTDPWNRDTDGDGIRDGFEGGLGTEDNWWEAEFVSWYAMYNDAGKAGGGLNPLTWDTDMDGLPDPWELEFHGSYTPGSATVVERQIVENGTTGTVSSVYATGVLWRMDGMDATVADQRLDYDYDGLDNWQEYMTGAMRCWRYDDPVSSWGLHKMSFETNNLPNAGSAEWNQFWYDRLLDVCNENGKYNPHLANGYFDAGVYFSLCNNTWDDNAYGEYYMFRDGVNHCLKNTLITKDDDPRDNPWLYKMECLRESLVALPFNTDNYPTCYITCDPRQEDSDGDGMDDFYELFHGLNPLLGAPGVTKNWHDGKPQPSDIVYSAYVYLEPDNYENEYITDNDESDTEDSGLYGPSALNNWWLNDVEPHVDVTIKNEDVGGYDFKTCPWLNGMAQVDPDGDSIVNQEEAIMPNIQAASTYHHSDPSPLWMTDVSYTNSLTRRYYHVWPQVGEEETFTYEFPAGQDYFEWNGQVYYFTEFDGFRNSLLTSVVEYEGDDTYFVYGYSSAGVNNFYSYGQLFSYEENEGYDSDHDYLSDYEEGQGKTKNASDVLDHDDPIRRQAMYFNGVDAFLQTPVAEEQEVPSSSLVAESRQNFLYFTVECWAKPDSESLANDNKLRTLVERAIWADNASTADETLMRKNFQIGINSGRWYACFDSSGTDKQPVEITDGPIATTNWTHIAATYDGTALKLYVNGVCNNNHNTSIQPEHGVAALALNRTGEINPSGGILRHGEFISILVGASAMTKHGIVYDWAWRYRDYANVDDNNPLGLAEQTTYGDYGNFYKGYIDEVRIWDGARTAASILTDYENRTRYTLALADENRQLVYNNWEQGATRSPATELQLPAQLMYHWAFDHIAGAVLPEDVIKVPAGFDTDKSVLNARATWSRPDDYTETRWVNSVVRSKIYSDCAWVPWINNTVSHLPRFDLTTLDSFYWSEDFAGDTMATNCGYASFVFPRSAEVYSRWSQLQYSAHYFYDNHFDPNFVIWNDGTSAYTSDTGSQSWTTKTRFYQITDYAGNYDASNISSVTNTTTTSWRDLLNKMCFAARDRNLVGDDILPMGGAYPRRISLAEGGMWDNKQGESATASDAWAQTGNDADNNGLPDWWEEYARENYCKDLDPETPIEWGTMVTYRNGSRMPAYQAYLRDLSDGMVKIGGEIKIDENYVDERDADRDGLPDWWEELYALDTTSSNSDSDPDNDGLSNYQEYILGEVYLRSAEDGGLADVLKAHGVDTANVTLNPTLAYSSNDQQVPDYFLRYSEKFFDVTNSPSHFYGNEYFGEIVTDHDFMEDWWERMYDVSYTSAKKYDALQDKDGDGWSAFAECRASLWGAIFTADIINQWATVLDYLTGSKRTAEYYIPCYPVPVLPVNLYYYGNQDAKGARTIVRTSSVQTGIMDATFAVPGVRISDMIHYIGRSGADSTIPLRGHLTYGMVEEAALLATCTYKDSIIFGNGVDDSDAIAYAVESDTPNIMTFNVGITKVGTLNTITGEFELNIDSLESLGYTGATYAIGYTSHVGYDWPRTIYLSDTRATDETGTTDENESFTGKGFIREGKNTIEAFIDLDSNGEYTLGEPYGVVKDVDIGWQKVQPVSIELMDDSNITARYLATTGDDDEENDDEEESSSNDLVRKLYIRRASVNGESEFVNANGVTVTVPRPVLATTELVTGNRLYMTESDVLVHNRLDLDWETLTNNLGDAVKDVKEVGYDIYEIKNSGTSEAANVVVGSFIKSFRSSRGMATAIAPINDAPVYASSPSFTFYSDDETMTAYRLQIRKLGDTRLVYDSGCQRLPARTSDTAGKHVYEVTPPIWAGANVFVNSSCFSSEFVDGTNYEWRVALFNAKYMTDEESAWSNASADNQAWAQFQMDIANQGRYPGLSTGYGSVSISVRYFGPTNDFNRVSAEHIIVEAFENADFTGQPAARTELIDIDMLGDRNDVKRHNALLRGLAPEDYYIRAFIDSNGNGKRDLWESWGYYCYVGKDMKAIYSPKPFTVTAATADFVVNPDADFTLYIEDTDVDQNEYPDCLQDVGDFANLITSDSEKDSDGDGLKDYEEKFYGTDPTLVDTDGDGLNDYDEVVKYGTTPTDADTDGDGMDDGWEVKFGTDPTVDDANYAGDGDVMAFATVEAKVLVATNGTTEVVYVVREQTDELTGQVTNNLLYTTFKVNETLYIGAKAENKVDITNRYDYAYMSTNVIAMHSAVYDFYGYDTNTARVATNAANTVAFTAYYKYLTQRFYLAEFDATDDFALAYTKLDSNTNYIPDGWELYVRYADEAENDLEQIRYAYEYNYDPWTTVDGIPNLWKILREIDPSDDSVATNTFVTGDVMAYATKKMQLVRMDDGSVALADEKAVIYVGDEAANLDLTATWAYGDDRDFGTEYYLGQYGVGRAFTAKAGVKVTSVESVDAVLVHAQVYAEYGFNPKTCVQVDDAVNTKEFTVMDKYLVVRYLEALGLANEAEAAKDGLWDKTTLDPNTNDFDQDGIADGWELYTMFGPDGVTDSTVLDDTVKISPWKYADARKPSPDGGLKLVEEYDNGSDPTDPWSVDTDKDNVIDTYAYQYHLKGSSAGEDADGDGLSNYAEYLISKVFNFAELDPDNAKTDDSCIDYFRKCGELYFGEVFTDHDQVGDLWEQTYSNFANRYVYDPNRDDDSDGWSNWAEYKAGTNPGTSQTIGVDGETLNEFPIPTIAVKVVYRGTNGTTQWPSNLTFQAWSQETDPDMTGIPDATWTATSVNEASTAKKYIGVNPGRVMSYYLGTGTVKPGSLRVWFRDSQAENALVVNDVEVSTTRGTDPKWYYFVEDVIVGNEAGELRLCATNRTPVKVGTIDYAKGLATIDFSCDVLQGIVYDNVVNGSGSAISDKAALDQYSCVKLDLSRSFVKIEWTPVMNTTTATATYYLSDATGHIREGLNKFVVFCDGSTDSEGGTESTEGEYDPGELFGFVKDVDVGWQGGEFTVELTATTPVFARIDLRADDFSKCSDRQVRQADQSTVVDVSSGTGDDYNDLLTELGVDYLGHGTDNEWTDLNDNESIRVRVVRALVDGNATLGKTMSNEDIDFTRRVIMDKRFNLNVRSYIHEGDFLDDDNYDADWQYLKTDVYDQKIWYFDSEENDYRKRIIDATNITYMIVLGEGDIALNGKSSGSNTIFKCMVSKTFDSAMARAVLSKSSVIRPVVDTTSPGIVYGERPTFRWSMQNVAGVNFNSYTAFKIEVYNTETGEAWDSGYRPLPPRDADGTYAWKVDEPLGSFLTKSTNYKWRVCMYNAKFSNDDDWNGYDEKLWSEPGSLVLSINNTQHMNDHGYSSIAACVKYTGPTQVLAKAVYDGKDEGKVRVQAFTSADFAGSPAGEYVYGEREDEDDTDIFTDTSDTTAPIIVRGLPQVGTYYLRAFIDSNGNGEKDDFESWGAASEPVTISEEVVTRPVVGIYIEDADTDGDWIPDAYEYVVKGNLTAMDAEIIGGDNIVFVGTVDTYTNATDAGISTGLSGASLTIFQNQSFVKMAVGGKLADGTVVSIDDVRRAVEKRIEPNTVKITALALAPDGKKVTLALDAEVTDSLAGKLLGDIYTISGVSSTVTVTVKVYRKDTLAAAGWGEPVYTTDVTFGRDEVLVDVDIDKVEMTSGFYKVEIEQR